MASKAQYTGKVAIITGSTSEIGHDLTKFLLSKGFSVAVTGRRVKEGEAIAKELDPEGHTVIFVQSDVSSYASQANLFRDVWNKWSRIDVVIASAGFIDKGSIYNLARKSAPVTELPPEPDLSCTDTDFKGVIYSTTLATHFMRHNPSPGGKIIVTGSMIGVHPCATFPEYCAAKAGVLHWCRVVAPVLLKKENITINCVLPGACDTPAMPGFTTAFLPEHLTLKSCLMSAYDVFLQDGRNTITGQAVETGHDKLYYYDIPEYKSGDVARRNEKVYEPWFAIIHGERSEPEDALQGPPNRNGMVP
ncbi:hypothetical protein SAPIO_CDS6489 [Scedosporium apiospermum]|uniref:15-hydroxyprostaglandin dehydrogenase n=1 Tax=Pseudallescheria apiosperma TaxID=563466 RepID=A0A084G3M0_PSEDA|nr:uncharacterized protein SAPIO_CDS6489 [Scedosporium apiospermum]KEZ41932.1 hypothetical protein SAPIO_CDS6489 [Scedosporium apiospermum]